MNQRNQTFFVFFILFSVFSYSQQKFTLSGTISEASSNENLIGVTIAVPELQTGVVTNEYGFYSLTLPKGVYQIQISYLGFEDIIQSKQELLEKWREGWACLFEALSTINPANFETEIYIRNQGHTVIEAINRQLSHYSYHVGQIVLLGKIQQKDNWNSLSIPKGESKNYNKEKFGKEKMKGHFTEEYINKEEK